MMDSVFHHDVGYDPGDSELVNLDEYDNLRLEIAPAEIPRSPCALVRTPWR